MARAGFTAIHAGRIRFGRDGRWYCDGEPIANAAICRLYARTMTVDPDGRARLELGEDRAEVEIEDTPWVVTSIEGDPRAGFTAVLNDATREPLDLDTLRLGPGNVPYCRMKAGRVEVRLLRKAWNELMRHAEPAPGDGCVLRAGSHRVALTGRRVTRAVHVALVAPEIPPNTGSIGRLCVATNTPLHLIEPLGFTIDDKHLRRAGLDYWPHLELHRWSTWDAFQAGRPPGRLLCFAARAARAHTQPAYRADDVLVFGGESHGLPAAIRAAHADALYGIPMASPHVRSLNLATAVAIVLFEGLRQLGQV